MLQNGAPPRLSRPQSRYWCFTINNYTDDDIISLRQHGAIASVSYLIFGREVAPTTGTLHLQGYIIFATRVRFTQARGYFPAGCHLEVSRGSPGTASDYCKKDGDFEEFGAITRGGGGTRSDVSDLVAWIQASPACPSEREIVERYPALWLRHASKLPRFVQLLRPPADFPDGDLRPWQSTLFDIIEADADDRTFHFYIDTVGNTGKSWFANWVTTHTEKKVQILSVGKRDDLAFCVDIDTKVFIFDIPRGQMEFLRYEILEQMKNRRVFSMKYESCVKLLYFQPHVIVFCNEDPDLEKMSEDRYILNQLE